MHQTYITYLRHCLSHAVLQLFILTDFIIEKAMFKFPKLNKAYNKKIICFTFLVSKVIPDTLPYYNYGFKNANIFFQIRPWTRLTGKKSQFSLSHLFASHLKSSLVKCTILLFKLHAINQHNISLLSTTMLSSVKLPNAADLLDGRLLFEGSRLME